MLRAKAVSAIGRAAAITVAAMSGTSANAADWTGNDTVQAGTYSTGLSSATAVNYLLWSDQAADNDNWNAVTYVIGDVANFNAASGTFNVVPTTATLNPSDINFTGGATYNFIRAGTGTGGSNATFAQATSLGPDSFSASPIWDASASATMDLTLDANFTGTVTLGNRPLAITTGYTGTTTISGGTLEVVDGSALPAASQNNPSITLNGGTFAVNVDGLNHAPYTFQQGARNPSTAQHGGTMTVTANSNFSNTATDYAGRARDQSNIWNGSINVANGTVLTVNTGGGINTGNNVGGAALTGTGTIRLGANAASSVGSNRLRLSGNLATGSTTLNFDLGTASGALQNSAAINGTTNLGSLDGDGQTLLTGTSNGVSATASASTISVGANGASTTFDGAITNGVSTTSSGGTPVTAGIRPEAKSNANTNITKVGNGSLTLNGSNLYGGTTTVSGGSLVAGNTHALGDGSGAVTVNASSTLDLNGNTQVAGKSYVLVGGSLLNNGGSSVTIHDGASGNFTTNGNAGAGQSASSGVWTSGTPTVTFSGGGGTGATGDVLLQLGWLRGHADGGIAGSGYLKEPKITFSDPDGITIANGGRPIKATPFLANTAGGAAVAGVTIIDPGYGYATVPTVTIDHSGTGGSGFAPVFTMTASGIRVTNAGSGYTSAPTVTFGGSGYAGFATGLGGFGSLAVNSTSSIGGTGDLVVNLAASGAGGLNKIGAGTLYLNAVNTYAGLTDVQAGTLGGTGSIAGNLQVGAAGSVAPGASIESFGVGGNADIDGTLVVEYDGSAVEPIDLLDVLGSLDISAATVDFNQLGAALDEPAYVFASYGSLPVEPFASVVDLPAGYTINYHYNDGIDSNNIALVPVPEPAGVGALAAVGLALAARRRRRD